MIKILQVVGKMHYGGMETLIMNIYRSIDRSEVQFDFLVHYREHGEYDDEIKRLGAKIFVMPKTTPSNLFTLMNAYNNFFKSHHEYDCIHVHLCSIAFLLFRQAKKYGTHCILHIHNSEIECNIKGYLGLFTTRVAVQKADSIFACSRKSAEFFVKSGKPFKIIKNGINTDKYYYNADIRKKVREELKLERKFVLICVARFAIQKNHKFLIDIINELKKIDSNICALLVGKGPLENKIKAKVKQLSLEKEIIFLGARDNVNELMQAADCYIMPSLSEGLGIAYIEAQAAGLITFASQEALNDEACITDLIKGIPLSESAQEWAKKIYMQRIYERKSQKETVNKSGFNIKETAAYLQEFYKNKKISHSLKES